MRDKLMLAFGAILLLSGCAMPMKSQEMLPQFDFYDQLDAKKYQDSISVRDVTVNDGVGGLSPVTASEYKSALVSALRQADLYCKEGEARYYLDANMSDMEQPFIGFNMTAKTTASYKIYKVKGGDAVFSETLTLPCTKTISDAFDGAVRARLASGCSVGENITHLIKILSQH